MMNERIRDLADQCRIETYGVNGELLEFGFNEEKFAELIVRDVVEQIITRERTDGEWYQTDIFKDFGVEE
jgi:hypothetical protein